jgi:hypothetical protein
MPSIRIILLSATLLFSPDLLAEIQIQNLGDRIFISADNCTTLNQELTSIRQWTETYGYSCRLDLPSGNREQCGADISDCLPPLARGLHGMSADLNGPNCWNLALVMREIVPGLRKADPAEMSFFLRSPLCRILERGERPRPGDIGAFRRPRVCDEMNPRSYDPRSCELHGFVYISDRLVFSKNDMLASSIYALQSVEEINRRYLNAATVQTSTQMILDGRGRWIPAPGGGFLSEQREQLISARNDLDYFRCMSFSDYLETQRLHHPSLRRAIAALEVGECYMGSSFIHPRTLSDSDRELLLGASHIIGHFLVSQRGSSMTEEERFVHNALNIRFRSLSENLMYLSGTRASDPSLSFESLGIPREELRRIIESSTENYR